MAQTTLKDNDLEFSQEDQANINLFSKLNMQLKDKQKQLAAKNDLLSQLDDAVTELEMLDDDEAVRTKFGDCFFSITTDQAKQYTEKHIEQEKSEIDELDGQLSETTKKLKKLKAVLYTKFGNSINLEED